MSLTTHANPRDVPHRRYRLAGLLAALLLIPMAPSTSIADEAYDEAPIIGAGIQFVIGSVVSHQILADDFDTATANAAVTAERQTRQADVTDEQAHHDDSTPAASDGHRLGERLRLAADGVYHHVYVLGPNNVGQLLAGGEDGVGVPAETISASSPAGGAGALRPQSPHAGARPHRGG